MSGAAFPRLHDYIKHLPRGLDSYPDCKMKGSLYLSALKLRPLPTSVDAELPPSLLPLIRENVLMSSWVDTPKSVAVLLAIVDHHKMADGDYYALIRQMNMDLFSSRIYRALMAMTSPALLLKGAALRFSGFHKGVTLEVEKLEKKSASLMMRFPSFLFDEIVTIGFRESIQVAMNLSNAPDGRVVAVEHGPRHLRMEATWS